MTGVEIREIDPVVCDYIINALKPVIEHLQHLVDQLTPMPKPVIPEEDKP